MPSNNINGPIPGENYTSNTKNYPWHRPPEITDLDKGVELAAKQLMSEGASEGLITMLESGMTIAEATDTFVTSGIGAGKWTPDYAILLAGPISHIIYLMAKGWDIDAEMGLDRKPDSKTKSYFNELKIDKQKVDAVLEQLDVPEVKQMIEQKVGEMQGGFMGAPPQGMNSNSEVPLSEEV